ncbi:putative mediator of RNA polymerase II transcription subunit 5 [Rhypophila decipiens]|uniref:Mediator of RNA polymerase II transcription subunit 5 n=1 Tax=Rhypophila decipiens TaxID=261697 RepID=A0AAN6YMJ2_9PEZI|nr:putative mediator of RNA polymerase II transcription subunit 5 [Rhypophila decipiens]
MPAAMAMMVDSPIRPPRPRVPPGNVPVRTKAKAFAGGVANLPQSLAEWTKFLSKAETVRLEPEKFASFVPILYSKNRLPRALIADLVLRPTRSNKEALCPRVSMYLNTLLKMRMVDVGGVLKASWRYSTLHGEVAKSTEQEDPDQEMGGNDDDGQQKQKNKNKLPLTRWRSSYSAEEILFWRLAKAVSNISGPNANDKLGGGNEIVGIRDGGDAISVLKAVTQWMALFTEATRAFSRDTFGAIHSLQAKGETESSRTAFVGLLLRVCENPIVLSVLGKDDSKDVRKKFAESLDAFLPTILQSQALHEIASRLDLFRTQTLASFEPADSRKDTAVSEISNYMDSLLGLERLQIPEIPIVNSRAGLYIYLDAALVGRPLIDDHALYTYFHNRYQGDMQTTAIQLILASFDVLANTAYNHGGAKTGHLLKSYVVNKVPLILSSFASQSSMYPFDAEFCITQALSQVDTNVFPTLSNMFDLPTSSSILDSVRQDFCFACQLHGLLSPRAIENLLGDITYQSLPDEGRYVKESLVQSCLEDAERTLKLIGELDNMNGNVGAAAQAIIDVIGTLCRSEGTMALKQICRELASKPLSLDILLLFDKPYKILHPLCELLDNWGANKDHFGEDDGESQPVYEEFGSILLLLLAFVYRYDLSTADLGIRSSESFVGKFLSKGSLSRPLDELTQQEKSHMNGWIHGLFDTEAGGLGDDLMSSCPPQDFYLLMPTLFNQIVLALSTGRLAEYMLKTGLEYLVDILLLPSLVPAMLFLSNQLWARQPTQAAIIRILQLILLQPGSMTHEASTMLSAVLNIVAKPLEHSLRSYQRQDPKSPDVEPLLRALKENLALSRRTGGTDHNELENWTGANGGTSNTSSTPSNPGTGANPAGSSPHHHHGGGLSGSVRSTIANLTQWAQHPALGLPAPYTHRQILAAIKMLGSKLLLSVLLEELKAQTELGNESVAYDVITSVICAPDTNNTFFTMSPSTDHDPATQQQQCQQQRRMTLRGALKNEAEDWNRIQKTSPDPLAVETIVRLYRRVETQMTPLPPPVHQVDANANMNAMLDSAAAVAVAAATAEMVDNALGVVNNDPNSAMGVGGSLDDAFAAAVDGSAAAGSLGVHDAMSLDTTGLTSGTGGGGPGGELSALDTSVGGHTGTGPGTAGGNGGMDDIFGGIQISAGSVDFTRDIDFNWDTMDMV